MFTVRYFGTLPSPISRRQRAVSPTPSTSVLPTAVHSRLLRPMLAFSVVSTAHCPHCPPVALSWAAYVPAWRGGGVEIIPGVFEVVHPDTLLIVSAVGDLDRLLGSLADELRADHAPQPGWSYLNPRWTTPLSSRLIGPASR
jgi:hypothetical protein